MKEIHIFLAIFEYQDGEEIAVLFPDLEVATSGVDDQDALNSAQELLELVLYGLQKDKEPIPTPSKIESINCKSNQEVFLINVNMDQVRNKVIELTI